MEGIFLPDCMRTPPRLTRSLSPVRQSAGRSMDKAPRRREPPYPMLSQRHSHSRRLLSSTQQATLEQAYTPALARKWSNLPCANTCRNGIGLGTLTPDQLTAALDVI